MKGNWLAAEYLLVCFGAVSGGLAGIPSPAAAGPPAVRFEKTEPHMGTKFKIVLYSTSKEQAGQAFSAAFARIKELDSSLSNYRPDSEVNRLCRSAPHADWAEVGRDLHAVLARSRRLSQLSGGAFDVTVGPVTKLWRRARRTKELPSRERLSEALAAVGFQLVQVHQTQHKIRLLRRGMQIDLGAIGKGYAIDQALAEIAALGISSALVDGGGDVAVSNAPPGRRAWRILLDDGNSQPDTCLYLSNQAVATSGDAFQFAEIGGVRYSHIVSPRTGLGLTESISATVVAPDATGADALASAMAVMGPADGKALAAKLCNTEARWAKPAGRGVKEIAYSHSQGFPRFTAPCEQQAASSTE